MHSQMKIGVIFLALTAITMNIAALNFDLIQGTVTCDMLRQAYEGVWYQPECTEDGSFKNPQCFESGFLFCCCINTIAPPNTTTSWLGDCQRFSSGPKQMPTCKQGRMVRSGNK